LREEVAERNRAEKALQMSEERFRTAAERSSDIVWELDRDSRRFDTWGSAGRAAEFPATVEELEKRLHPDDRQRVSAAVRRLLESGSAFSEGYQILAGDGRYRFWHSRGAIAGNLRIIGASTDITERKQLETELHQSQRLEAVGQLAAGIAHEI